MSDNTAVSVEGEGKLAVNPMLPSPAKPRRNASFELLRILCMFFIIGHHFIFHGGWDGVTDEVTTAFIKLFSAFFLPSVNLFVMIGAYFMCTSTSERVGVRRIAKLWGQVFFYSVLLFVVFVATDTIPYSGEYLLQTLLPTLKEKYWFFSAYIVMLVLSPFLNAMLRNLSRRSHLVLCLLILVAAEITSDAKVLNTTGISTGYNAVWFCCLYVIAAYLRLRDVRLTRTKAILGGIVYVATIIVGQFAYLHYSSALVCLSAVYVFLAFKHLNIKNERLANIIRFISPLTFGVYLIHDSPEMRSYMYENIFHCSQMYDLPAAFLIMIAFAIATFIACAACEFLRRELFDCAAALFKRLRSRKQTV